MRKSSYRDLDVWQEARALTKDIYILTRSFPRTETFGLVSQMRRSALSIPCNIAEGKGRWNVRDYRRFVLIARGSTFELESQIIIAADIGYIDDPDPLIERTNEIAKKLNGLLRYLAKKRPVTRHLSPVT